MSPRFGYKGNSAPTWHSMPMASPQTTCRLNNTSSNNSQTNGSLGLNSQLSPSCFAPLRVWRFRSSQMRYFLYFLLLLPQLDFFFLLDEELQKSSFYFLLQPSLRIPSYSKVLLFCQYCPTPHISTQRPPIRILQSDTFVYSASPTTNFTEKLAARIIHQLLIRKLQSTFSPSSRNLF